MGLIAYTFPTSVFVPSLEGSKMYLVHFNKTAAQPVKVNHKWLLIFHV